MLITLLIVLNPFLYSNCIVPMFKFGIFNLVKKFSNSLYLCSSFDSVIYIFFFVLSHFQLPVGNSGSTLYITLFTSGIICPALYIYTFAPLPKPFSII